jgi:hypothetical protein
VGEGLMMLGECGVSSLIDCALLSDARQVVTEHLSGSIQYNVSHNTCFLSSPNDMLKNTKVESDHPHGFLNQSVNGKRRTI